MVYFAGVDLQPVKHVRYALMKFPGIGRATAVRICDKALIHKFCKISDLNEEQMVKLRALVQEHLDRQKQEKMITMKKLSRLSSYVKYS